MNNEVELFLKGIDVDVSAVASAARDLCVDAMPGAHEMVYHEALGYSVSDSPMERVTYVSPQHGHVNLTFCFGAGLEDPAGILEGTGVRMRHIKLRSAEAAANPAVRAMVVQAWAAASEDLGAQLTNKRGG